MLRHWISSSCKVFRTFLHTTSWPKLQLHTTVCCTWFGNDCPKVFELAEYGWTCGEIWTFPCGITTRQYLRIRCNWFLVAPIPFLIILFFFYIFCDSRLEAFVNVSQHKQRTQIGCKGQDIFLAPCDGFNASEPSPPRAFPPLFPLAFGNTLKLCLKNRKKKWNSLRLLPAKTPLHLPLYVSNTC